LHGTQTKYNFVPEQSTDFIFCTVGEEWGFVGSLVLIAVYIYLIIRILILSDKNPDNFARIYGYCVASIFFMHVFINLGMTMGIMPVIGIPLPFLSYGGSSMLSFTILLFIFIRLDMERQNR
jgi:rod shape determining protein RodA